jgi:hypothetical protein
MRAARGHDDLICVGVDDQVGVMGDDDDLSALFGASEALDYPRVRTARLDARSRRSACPAEGRPYGTIKANWDPRYVEKQDSRCGLTEQ